MNRYFKLLVMSLVLLLGLWGYSMSKDNPYPRTSNDALVSGGPAYDDHPWGGDQGHNGNGGTTVSRHIQQPIVTTGIVAVDLVINQITFRHSVINFFFGTKTQTTIPGSTGTPNAPAVGNNLNSAN